MSSFRSKTSARNPTVPSQPPLYQGDFLGFVDIRNAFLHFPIFQTNRYFIVVVWSSFWFSIPYISTDSVTEFMFPNSSTFFTSEGNTIHLVQKVVLYIYCLFIYPSHIFLKLQLERCPLTVIPNVYHQQTKYEKIFYLVTLQYFFNNVV